MAAYKPGLNPIVTGKSLSMNRPSYKRLMQGDEFLYYMSFLFEETMALPVKAAIGIVLKADLIRLYGKSYEMFEDKDVSFWADYYTTLGSYSKQLADSEIYHFEVYLGTPKIPLDTYAPGTIEAVARRIAENNKKIQDYQPEAVADNERRYVEEFWKTKKTALEEERKTKELKEHLENADPAIMARKDAWIKQNFVSYLAGYFVRHPLSLRADSEKSEWEFKVREDVLKMVRTGLMSATDALAYYVTALDLITGAKDAKEFFKLMGELTKPTPAHPLVKVMYKHIEGA